jgi:hypothetical protein
MRQPERRFRPRDTVLLSGWLFADLLLALAVIFLSANTVGVKPKVIATPIPTPTPTPTLAPTPSPTPLPRLELHKHTIVVSIDANGLLNNSPDAINSLKQEMRAQSILRGRSVGLVIAYGGASDDSQIGKAQAVAVKVMSVLMSLGSGGFAFSRASYYDPLYLLGGDINTAVIDVYLFAQ